MGRGEQIIRQWRVLRHLDGARSGRTVPEIRDALDVRTSVRTLYRDLHDLVSAGFPIESEDGRWRLIGAAQRPVPVSTSEVLALAALGDLASPLRETPLAACLDELRTKLEATLTPTSRAYLVELKKTVQGTVGASVDYRPHADRIRRIEQGAQLEQCLRIAYAKPGAAPDWRTVEPYCTWFHSGRLYLVARCQKVQAVRIFAVQRIHDVELLEEVFDVDPDFDAASFVRSGFGVFHGETYEFVVDFAPEIAHVPREFDFHSTQSVTPLEDGWVRLRMRATGLPEVAAWVAGFGGHARPVRPPILFDAVKRLHEEALNTLSAAAPG